MVFVYHALPLMILPFISIMKPEDGVLGISRASKAMDNNFGSSKHDAPIHSFLKLLHFNYLSLKK